MKKRYKIIMKPLLFVVLFLCAFAGISKMLSVNDNASQMIVNGFFKEPQNSLDVVLIGPSEFYADYSAPLAWKQYGYTSYSLSMGGAPGSLYQPMLEATLNTQTPKLVVFELNGFIHGSNSFQDPVELHRWIDNVPWTAGKYEMIQNIIPKEKRNQYYCSLMFSHVNWKRPFSVAKNTVERICMNCQEQSYTKGFNSVSQINLGVAVGQTENIDFSYDCEKLLKQLLQFCKNQELKNVLFVRLPHERAFSNPKKMEEIETIIQQYGYNTLNLNDKAADIGIKVPEDYSDADHLNVNGMEKMTAYLGKYIQENYDVKENHTEDTYKRWDKSIKYTNSLIDQCRIDLKKNITRVYYEAAVYWKPMREK